MRISSEKGFSLSGMSDRSRWILIIAEIALSYAIIYISTIFNWPKHEFLRFLTLIPLYQAGIHFGYAGGIVGGVIISLFFMPLVQIDPLMRLDPTGSYHGIAMMVFINIFGVFVGGAIGNGRKARRSVDLISRVTLNIARETDPENVMLRLAREAADLIETEYTAFLMTDRHDEITALDARTGETTSLLEFPADHPLVWCARTKQSLATNCPASDPRFAASDPSGRIKSIMAVPIASENDLYGALLLANKRNDEHFNAKDLSMAELLAGTAGTGIHNYKQEIERQEQKLKEQRMKDLFSRFVSSSVADYVLENPDLLKGRWQEVTVLVSDIRDFTPLSEKLSPQELVAQLNEYFTAMVDIIFERTGTIDKFIGDCIIAYWGAPAPDSDHAPHAAQAAMQMASALDLLNEKWTSEGRPVFRTGIALHTCKVLMGNLGDERKRAFTIMGEEVEKAMAIESLTKRFGVRVILSEQTVPFLAEDFNLEKLPEVDSVEFENLYQLVLEQK